MVLDLVAHAGEVHENTVESTFHSTEWYVQLPVFFLIVAVISGAIWLLTKSRTATTIVMSVLLLIGGFAMFSLTPIISIVSISTGLLAGLFLLLIGVAEKTSDDKDKNLDEE